MSPPWKCIPKSNPDNVWPYCPSPPAAIIFSVLFFLTTLAHLIQAFIHRKPFAWVLIMGSAWELAGYIFRTLDIWNQTSQTYYTGMILLILLAPLWINAFIYMVFGRMTYFYLDSQKVLGISAKRFPLIFVLCDILAFLVQAFGASMASGDNVPASRVTRGFNIYTGGVGLQELFLLLFTSIAIRFHLKISRGECSDTSPFSSNVHRSSISARKMLQTLYTVILLLSIRIIFRIIEFSQGLNGSIPNTEWPSYVFDATPMFLALCVLSYMHPGRFLKGEGSEYPKKSRAEMKAEKKAKKEEKAEKARMKKGRRGWFR